MRQRLTDLAVERLKPLQKGRLEFWDTLLPSFGLRVTHRGKKTWVIMYRLGGRKSPKRRLSLGPYPAVSLARARKLAHEAFEQVARGNEPTILSKAAADADLFPAVAAQFIERYAKAKNKGWKRQESDINRLVMPHWKYKRIVDITRKDVLQVLDHVSDRSSTVRANRVLALIRRLFNWCLERGLLEVSPAASVKPPGKRIPVIAFCRTMNCATSGRCVTGKPTHLETS